jgi:phage tail sheath gpL-like
MKSVKRNTTGINTPNIVAINAPVPFVFPARRMEQSAAVTAAFTADASRDIFVRTSTRRGRIRPEENAALLLRRATGAAGVKALAAATNTMTARTWHVLMLCFVLALAP